MKVHNISGQKERFAAGTVVQICNSLDDTPIELRNIDYGYYYRECMKIIEPVKLGISPKGKGKTRVKKYAGMYNKLFDDDETD